MPNFAVSSEMEGQGGRGVDFPVRKGNEIRTKVSAISGASFPIRMITAVGLRLIIYSRGATTVYLF